MKGLLLSVLMIAWARTHIESNVEFVQHETMEDPCWLWKRSNDGRYGQVYFAGTRIKAHILSFIAFGNFLKRHQVVDHLCHKTLCCNPRHLRAATQSQNIARCFREGRGRSPFLKETRNDCAS